MKKCPYCAEEIQDAAIVCRYCQRDLPQVEPVATIAQADGAGDAVPPPGPASTPPGTSWVWPAAILGLVGVAIAGYMMSREAPEKAALRAELERDPAGFRQRMLEQEELLKKLEAGDRSPDTLAKAEASLKPSSNWRTVQEWSGSGIKQTDTFTTTGREWRVRWTSKNEPFPNASILQIYVHDEQGRLITLAANKQGSGSDVSYVRSPPGRHYLAINSGNCDWTVTVEEQR